MATSLAAGRPPGPRARPPRRPRHQAPPRGRAGTRAAPWRHLPGQNNKDQNQDQNPQNRIRTKIATRERTRKPKTTRGPHRGGGGPAGWPHKHGAKNSAQKRFNPSPPSVGQNLPLRDKLTRRGTTSPNKVPIPGQSPGANALVALTLRPDYLYVLVPRDHFPRVRPRGHLRPVRDRPHNQTRHRMVETGRGKYLSWARLRRGLGLPPPPAGNGAHAPPSRLTSRAVMACTVKAGVTTV